MNNEVPHVVEAILTAILQWRVLWLDEQKKTAKPPPICRAEPKRLKIIYENYKDYEATFIPLLMHEIWAQIFDEWSRLESEIIGATPMDVDFDEATTCPGSNSILTSTNTSVPRRSAANAQQRRFQIGVMDIKREGQYQLNLKCQYIIEAHKVPGHMKIVGEGDLVRLDAVLVLDPNQVRENQEDCIVDAQKGTYVHGLFGYVSDVSSERITRYTHLAACFGDHPERFRSHHVVNYSVIIAKRPLRLKLDEPMRLSALYYLKPMIRQIESVAMLKESILANDILNPKIVTCQLSVPTVVSIKSPYYNDSQYKAIIGAYEALSRPYEIPKIQLIQGPPGTGKTHTLIGIIKHFYMNLSSRMTTIPKILICAPSNGAIDEVARRLMKERDSTKKGSMKRSLRLVRVGHPDQISEAVKIISLEELVEANVKVKAEDVKKKSSKEIRELEDELSRCDTEITNLRFLNREKEIPDLEHKIAKLSKELENKKNSEEVTTRREVSEASRRNLRYELVKNADVILTTLNSCQRHPLDSLFRRDERADLSFHCVIVDEASQCVEPELLMPLCYKISKMILIGDPMQLPATVISRYAQEFDFGRSLFERFFIHFGKYDAKSPIAMLTDQYRMHPDICHFPSKQFYDGRLVTACNPKCSYPFKPYILFEIRHGSQKSNSTSLENEVEASLIRNILTAVVTKAPEKSSVGVITPYKSQKRLLTNMISSLQSQRQIKVDINTCDGFQGQEKDIIILSCVRTFDYGNSIGFLKSFQRVNVALTRAKSCLIVCLSGKASSRDKTWAALVDDAVKRRIIQTLLNTPSIPSLTKMIEAEPRSKYVPPPVQPINSTSNTPPSVAPKYVPDYIMPMDID